MLLILRLFAFTFVLQLCKFSQGTLPIPSGQIGTLHRRTYFYVGEVYVPSDTNSIQNSSVATGQMYVEHLVPATVTQPYPILFIHGHGEYMSFDLVSNNQSFVCSNDGN